MCRKSKKNIARPIPVVIVTKRMIVRTTSYAVLIIMWCACAEAGQIVQSGSYPLGTTNWQNLVTLEKFDGTLGTLDSVELNLTGEIVANAGYENLSDVSNDITLRAAADISATIPNNSFLQQYGFQLTITPANLGTFWNVPGFDGLNNFNDASGQMFTDLTGADSRTLSTALALTFHPLIRTLIHEQFTDVDGVAGGLETVDLLVGASGASIANDVRGNVASIFQTSAAGSYSLIYNYQTLGTIGSTPEPRSVVSFILGAFGLIALRRRCL